MAHLTPHATAKQAVCTLQDAEPAADHDAHYGVSNAQMQGNTEVAWTVHEETSVKTDHCDGLTLEDSELGSGHYQTLKWTRQRTHWCLNGAAGLVRSVWCQRKWGGGVPAASAPPRRASSQHPWLLCLSLQLPLFLHA